MCLMQLMDSTAPRPDNCCSSSMIPATAPAAPAESEQLAQPSHKDTAPARSPTDPNITITNNLTSLKRKAEWDDLLDATADDSVGEAEDDTKRDMSQEEKAKHAEMIRNRDCKRHTAVNKHRLQTLNVVSCFFILPHCCGLRQHCVMISLGSHPCTDCTAL